MVRILEGEGSLGKSPFQFRPTPSTPRYLGFQNSLVRPKLSSTPVLGNYQ